MCSFDFIFNLCTCFRNRQIFTRAESRAFRACFSFLSHPSSDCKLSCKLLEETASLHAYIFLVEGVNNRVAGAILFMATRAGGLGTSKIVGIADKISLFPPMFVP